MKTASPEASPGSSRFLAAHLAGASFFLGTLAIGNLLPDVKIGVFCRAAAWLSSFVLRAPVEETATGFLLAHSGINVHVVEACSGFDFFSLLVAVLAGVIVYHTPKRHRMPWALSLVLPIGFIVTVLANSARIVTAVYVRLFSEYSIIQISPEATHWVVGLCIFAPVLFATSCLVSLLYAER